MSIQIIRNKRGPRRDALNAIRRVVGGAAEISFLSPEYDNNIDLVAFSPVVVTVYPLPPRDAQQYFLHVINLSSTVNIPDGVFVSGELSDGVTVFPFTVNAPNFGHNNASWTVLVQTALPVGGSVPLQVTLSAFQTVQVQLNIQTITIPRVI